MPNMKPGRELDSLIAEKVMGLKVRKPQPEYSIDPNRVYLEELDWSDCKVDSLGYYHKLCPEYSTDIAAAWRVVEKLNASMRIGTQGFGWDCGFMSPEFGVVQATGDTAPHAICLAALQAIEG